MIRVVEANTSAQLQQARELLRGFPIHQREHYTAHRHIVDRYFDDAAYAEELEELHPTYGPPGGCVLLAYDSDAVAGAVCMHPVGTDACEMKRLFILPDHRRKGIARTLCDALLDKARTLGYARMVLDTGTFMVESQALYRSMGFRYIEPYYAVREELRDGLVYMELTL